MENKDDEIIYLALSNQIQSYLLLLEEEKDISEEERNMIEYIISRSEYLLTEYAQRIGTDTSVSRPEWDQLKEN